MSVIPSNLSRVSDSLRSMFTADTLSRTNLDLLRIEQQITSGMRLTAPSDDPAGSRLALALLEALGRTEQYLTNVNQAQSRLGMTDSALAEVSDLLLTAQSAGEQELGAAGAQTRAAAAQIVGAVIDSVLTAANRASGRRALFAGLADTEAPFELLGSAILYRGDDGQSALAVGDGQTRAVSISGAEAFGAWQAVVDNHKALHPVITPLTPLTDLAGGGPIDLAGGLRIANGQFAATLDLTSCCTVQDLLNAINTSGCYVLARIAPEGDRIVVVSQLSGAALTIGENGGATAADLGLRSLDAGTPLSALNRGRGVRLAVSGPDLNVTLSDGSTVEVSLAGAATVQDVADRINAAAPGRLAARLARMGNGLELADLSGGTGALSVESVGGSFAAEDLGLRAAEVSGSTLVGRDVNPLVAENALTHLLELREALLTNDGDGIARALVALRADADQVTAARGAVGAKLLGLEADRTWLTQQQLADQDLLSHTRDVDFNAALTRFTTLQTLLTAALQMTARIGRLSLLDYL
jgi:flagellin-like hook-associated protein FlgL